MLNFFVLLGFFGAFFSPAGMLSYFSGVSVIKVKFGLFDCLYLLYVITLLLVTLLLYSSPITIISIFRFYFGFVVFYLYFKSGADFPIRKLFLLLLVLVPMEAFLINSVISPHSMPNFPSADMTSHFNPGGYQRPYSFGGNSSVSSSILVILLSMVSISSISTYAAIGCVFIFSSGSGLMSLMLLGILKRIKVIAVLSVFIVIFIVVFHSKIIDSLDALDLKVNSKYILFLIDFKINQLVEHFHGFTTIHYLFGNVDSLKDGYGGDFGWLYFILAHGVLSFFVMIAYILSKMTRGTLIPIFIALFATFHYPVIFFLPGQIILGYLMAMKYRKVT